MIISIWDFRRVWTPTRTLVLGPNRLIFLGKKNEGVHFGVSIYGGTPIAGWFIRENPIKIDDLGVALFSETPICSKRGFTKIPRVRGQTSNSPWRWTQTGPDFCSHHSSWRLHVVIGWEFKLKVVKFDYNDFFLPWACCVSIHAVADAAAGKAQFHGIGIWEQPEPFSWTSDGKMIAWRQPRLHRLPGLRSEKPQKYMQYWEFSPIQ